MRARVPAKRYMEAWYHRDENFYEIGEWTLGRKEKRRRVGRTLKRDASSRSPEVFSRGGFETQRDDEGGEKKHNVR